METQTVKQLRQIVKDRRVRGYSKLQKAELLDLLKSANLLDSPVGLSDIQAPVLQPTAYVPPQQPETSVISSVTK